jgi:transcriptional regulator GlxA family with amidase domain
MQIAVVLYPSFTALDMVGPFEVLSGVPGVELVLVAAQAGPVVTDNASLTIPATHALDDVPSPDVVLVPGGMGSSRQMTDGPLHEWLRSVDGTASWMTSVCTGSLILAAAGLLQGRRATSHWLAVDQLADLGAIPVDERVVVDGRYVTAAGVSAGIDMGLTLVAQIGGVEAAQSRQLSMEYAPAPPFNAGSPHTAPQAVVQKLLDRAGEILTGSPGPT